MDESERQELCAGAAKCTRCLPVVSPEVECVISDDCGDSKVCISEASLSELELEEACGGERTCRFCSPQSSPCMIDRDCGGGERCYFMHPTSLPISSAEHRAGESAQAPNPLEAREVRELCDFYGAVGDDPAGGWCTLCLSPCAEGEEGACREGTLCHPELNLCLPAAQASE